MSNEVEATPRATSRGLAGSGKIAYFAIGLWIVVGSLLSYGIFETVSKAAAFF
ncbi:hypothetical protein ACFSYH_14560 [Populibacterium corticicola]|jgi:muconolactone delta-isomerase|uniref:Uncharacterized protein n=1 Tax=Populibacterium corticicola TaxID=1812826 RepID=A0ABW5XKD4_9MICO